MMMDRYPNLKHTYQQYLDDYKAGKIQPGKCSTLGLKNCCCGICGCFYGEDMVRMWDGTEKEINNLQQGDIVEGGYRVLCTVEFIHSGNHVDMVEIPNGPTLTPWHPVYIKKWTFPADLYPVIQKKCFQVYNFVLDSGHILNVNGYKCITLAHGRTDPVLAHPYFGTDKILEDLEKHDGFEEGRVVFVDAQIERDENGLVCKIS